MASSPRGSSSGGTAARRRRRAADRSSVLEAGAASSAELRRAVADQPAGLLVVGGDVVARGVERERRLTLVGAGLEGGGQGPAAVLAAPGVPVDAARVDVLAAQVAADRVAERAAGRRGGAGRAAQGRALGALGDVLALGEHRGGERHDLVDRGLGRGGDGLGGLAGTDPRLDVARSQDALHLDLQLAEAGPSVVVAAQDGPEVGVDVEGELDPGVGHEQQAFPVLAQTREGEVDHLLVVLLSPEVRAHDQVAGSGSGCGRAYARATPRQP